MIACIKRDKANKMDTSTVALYRVFSRPLLLKLEEESEEKAPPASGLARCNSTKITSKTDSTIFTAKIIDCMVSILSY
ncbi:MAG: hypothetical protein QG614_392 [Patescibacteria group bacterium]|nr:hypothetical protein [Patescibacteria group bacterium]